MTVTVKIKNVMSEYEYNEYLKEKTRVEYDLETLELIKDRFANQYRYDPKVSDLAIMDPEQLLIDIEEILKWRSPEWYAEMYDNGKLGHTLRSVLTGEGTVHKDD